MGAARDKAHGHVGRISKSKRRAQAQGGPREAEACRESRIFGHGDAAPQALDSTPIKKHRCGPPKKDFRTRFRDLR
jgi:hypothetical protein